ncbi:MAG: DUF721 domain-containing protein [Magnetococcales bacterium]|nr:DUF721 domain-containing protein [Magnetococcales bacterium]
MPDEESVLPPGPMSDLIRSVAGRLLDHPSGKGSRLTREWRLVVGGVLAAHSEPVRLQNGVLTVRVDSPVWMSELSFLTPELLKKLQEKLPSGGVTGLRFRQESLRQVPVAVQKKSPPRHPPLPEEESRADLLTAAITDPPLKRAVMRFLLADMICKRLKSAR